MFKKTLLAITISSLSACQLTGGQAAYEIEPIVTNDDKVICCKVICCKVKINNTKDIDSVEVKFKVGKDGEIDMSLKEKGVKASEPAAVMAEANATMLKSLLNKIPVGN